MRIRTFFLTCLSVIAAAALFASGLLVRTQWQDFARAGDAAVLADTLHAVLVAAERVTIERGLRNIALIADTPMTDAASTQRLASEQAAADTALADARGKLAGSPLTDRDAAVGEFDRLIASHAELNLAVAAAIPLPKAARPAELVQSYVLRTFGFLTPFGLLADRLEQTVNAASPQVGTLSSVGRLAWDMRDFGGRRSNIFLNIAATGKPPGVAQAQTLGETTGAIDHAWARLQSTAAGLGSAPLVAAALDDVKQHYFPDSERVMKTVLDAVRAGLPSPLTPTETRDQMIGAVSVALRVREAAFAEAANTAGEARHAAGWALAAASLLLLVLAASVVGVGIVFGRRVVRPLVGMTDAIARLAAGDRAIDVPGRGRRDEIGRMAEALETLRCHAVAAADMAAEQASAQAAKVHRAGRLEELTQVFQSAVATLTGQLGVAAADMTRTAGTMSARAEQTNRQSAAVAMASEQTSGNVQTVATATEQLAASIQEISQQVAHSARIASNAVEDATRTDATVQTLARASLKIGEVVALIQGIAARTNLLALNATIEAARAGEAGKGFAVVASEVKSLATQTAKATEDITVQIGAIQGSTEEAVQAVRAIGRTIGEINAIAAAIASAVEQQSAATQEISRSVQQAARGTEEVSDNISGVRQAATDAGAAADQVLDAAGRLSGQSEALTHEVDHFIAAVHAA